MRGAEAEGLIISEFLPSYMSITRGVYRLRVSRYAWDWTGLDTRSWKSDIRNTSTIFRRNRKRLPCITLFRVRRDQTICVYERGGDVSIQSLKRVLRNHALAFSRWTELLKRKKYYFLRKESCGGACEQKRTASQFAAFDSAHEAQVKA